MSDKRYLSRADILEAKDQVTEEVDVPEWGGVVRVCTLSAAEKDSFEGSLTLIQQVGNKVYQKPNLHNVRAKLAARCIVDEDGKRLFTDNDVLELGRKSGAALDRVIEVAKRLNRMDEAELQMLVDGLKNDPPAASPSD